LTVLKRASDECMIEKDLGFVLRRSNFRDTSVIANIYTLRFGRIAGILKGFYSGKREFTSPLEVFTLNEFVFYPKKREIWLVSFADLLCDYPILRTDLARSRAAGFFLNIVERVMQPWDVNSQVFFLLKESMAALQDYPQTKVLYVFLIKFLTISGFKPEFNHCIHCRGELGEDLGFSAAKGGLVCGKCRAKSDDCRSVTGETSSSLSYIQKTDFPQVLRIRPTPACEKEIMYVLRQFIAYHLDIDLSGLNIESKTWARQYA